MAIMKSARQIKNATLPLFLVFRFHYLQRDPLLITSLYLYSRGLWTKNQHFLHYDLFVVTIVYGILCLANAREKEKLFVNHFGTQKVYFVMLLITFFSSFQTHNKYLPRNMFENLFFVCLSFFCYVTKILRRFETSAILCN